MEIDKTKWTIIIICLMLIWGSLWLLFYLKADEVTNDPCSICAKRMGVNVMCTQLNTSGLIPAVRTYYSNGTIYDGSVQFKEDCSYPSFNLTLPNG